MNPNELAVIRVEPKGDTVFAEIIGEVDPSNSRELGRQITESVPNNAMAVVVDVSGVTFLDSSGVQMLFELAERLSSRQQRFSVVVPPECPARRVLDIVAFSATAPVLDSRQELETNGCS